MKWTKIDYFTYSVKYAATLISFFILAVGVWILSYKLFKYLIFLEIPLLITTVLLIDKLRCPKCNKSFYTTESYFLGLKMHGARFYLPGKCWNCDFELD